MNKNYTTDDLLRYLEGRLSADAKDELERTLTGSPALQESLARVKATQDLLQQTAADTAEDALAPFFTDRLMKKLARETASSGMSLEEEMAAFLGRLFRPVAIAGLFLALCLAVYNINLSNDYTSDPSTAESILAMPPLTSTAIYDLDYYATESLSSAQATERTGESQNSTQNTTMP